MPYSPRKIVATAASLRPKRNITKKNDSDTEPPAKKTVEKKVEKKQATPKKKEVAKPKAKATKTPTKVKAKASEKKNDKEQGDSKDSKTKANEKKNDQEEDEPKDIKIKVNKKKKDKEEDEPKDSKEKDKVNEKKNDKEEDEPQESKEKDNVNEKKNDKEEDKPKDSKENFASKQLPMRQSKRIKDKAEETDQEEIESKTETKPNASKKMKKNNSKAKQTEEEKVASETEDAKEMDVDSSAESFVDDGELDDDDDSDFDPDNDPEKLWCFCKKPHGNRFMICCDTCEGWFHGDCVGVTMARGREMEKTGEEWCCRECQGKRSFNKVEDEQESQTPLNTPLREVDTKPIDPSTLSKARSLSLDKMKTNFAKLLKEKVSSTSSTTETKDGKNKNTDDLKPDLKNEKVDTDKTDIVTEKKDVPLPQPFVGDIKEIGNSKVDGNAENNAEQNKTKSKESPEKLQKRRESDKSSLSDLITFDHIPTSAKKDGFKRERQPSTEDEKKRKHDITPKPKGHRTPSTKSPKEAIRYCLRDECNRPALKNSIYCGRECIFKYALDSIKQIDDDKKKSNLTKSPDTKQQTKGTTVISPATSSTDRVNVQERIAVFERSTGKIVAGVMAPTKKYLFAWLEEHPTYEIWKSDKQKSKMKNPKKNQDEMVRSNVRKSLRETLLTRCKDDQMAINLEALGNICVRIEKELLRMFSDTGNKYKTKYRSLIFNLRDNQNKVLYKRVVSGEISPKKLVSMTPEQLATPELAQWREQENRRHIEMIKKREEESAELQRKPVVKKTYKGEVEIEGDNTEMFAQTPSGESQSKASIGTPVKAAVIPQPNSSKPSTEEVVNFLKDTTSEHSHHLFDSNCKICTGQMAPPGESHMTGVSTTVLQPEVSDPSLNSPIDTQLMVVNSPASPDTSTNITTPPSPTSTSQPVLTVRKQPSVWRGFIFMQKVSKFVTTAYAVSGSCENLMDVLPDTINVCGRIHPKEVWDYLGQLKANRRLNNHNSIDVIRFEMASDEEKAGYIRFYTYFYTRQRIGVVGNCHSGVKDMYIVPLASTDPVPSELKPLPGLPKPRPHMLLGIIVRVKSVKAKIEEFITVDSSPESNFAKKKKKKKEKKKEKEIDLERVELEAQKKLVDIIIKSHTSVGAAAVTSGGGETTQSPVLPNPLDFLKSFRTAASNILSTSESQQQDQTSKDEQVEKLIDKQETSAETTHQSNETKETSHYTPSISQSDKIQEIYHYQPPQEDSESIGHYEPPIEISDTEADKIKLVSHYRPVLPKVVITPDPLLQTKALDQDAKTDDSSNNREASIFIPAPEDVVKNIKETDSSDIPSEGKTPEVINIDENVSDSVVNIKKESRRKPENIPLLGSDCPPSSVSATSPVSGPVDFKITSTEREPVKANENETGGETMDPSDEDYVANLIDDIELPPRPPEFPLMKPSKSSKGVMPGLPPIQIPGFSPPDTKLPRSTIEEMVNFRPPVPDAAPWIPLPPTIKLPPGVPFPPLPPTMPAMKTSFGPISPPLVSKNDKTGGNPVDPRTRGNPVNSMTNNNIPYDQQQENIEAQVPSMLEKHSTFEPERIPNAGSVVGDTMVSSDAKTEQELTEIRTNQLAALILQMSAELKPQVPPQQIPPNFPGMQQERFQNFQGPQPQQFPQQISPGRFSDMRGMRPNRFSAPHVQPERLADPNFNNRLLRPRGINQQPFENPRGIRPERFPNMPREEPKRFHAPLRGETPSIRPLVQNQPNNNFRPEAPSKRHFNPDNRPFMREPFDRPPIRQRPPFHEPDAGNKPRFPHPAMFNQNQPRRHQEMNQERRPFDFQPFHSTTRQPPPRYSHWERKDDELHFQSKRNFNKEEVDRQDDLNRRDFPKRNLPEGGNFHPQNTPNDFRRENIRGDVDEREAFRDDIEQASFNRDDNGPPRNFQRNNRWTDDVPNNDRETDRHREFKDRPYRRDFSRNDRRRGRDSRNWDAAERNDRKRRRHDNDFRRRDADDEVRRRDDDNNRRREDDPRRDNEDRHGDNRESRRGRGRDDRSNRDRRRSDKNEDVEDFRSKVYGTQRYNYRDLFDKNAQKDNQSDSKDDKSNKETHQMTGPEQSHNIDDQPQTKKEIPSESVSENT